MERVSLEIKQTVLLAVALLFACRLLLIVLTHTDLN